MEVTQLWWISLGIFAVVVVVVAILLGLIIAAAKSIDRHAGNIWVAGKQIAGNTVSIWMLRRTVEDTSRVLDETRRLNKTAASMNEKLRALATLAGGRS